MNNNEKPKRQIIDLENPFGTISPETALSLITQFDITKFNTCNINYLTIYHYNSESINDSGWGCAWRSTQTALHYALTKNKQININIPLKNLYNECHTQQQVETLFCECYQLKQAPQYIIEKDIAPETNKGWAEPFISKLILHKYGIKGELFLLNGYPLNAIAPENVFDKVLMYNEFEMFLEKHFQKENPSPIIIDDAQVSLIICGISKLKENDGGYTLIIIDPHVRNDPLKEAVYLAKIDKEGNLNQSNNIELGVCLRFISFSKKKWMVYVSE
jgi:hypothetical protein